MRRSSYTNGSGGKRSCSGVLKWNPRPTLATRCSGSFPTRLPSALARRGKPFLPLSTVMLPPSPLYSGQQLAAHPRAVEWLDGLISRAIVQWEDRHGPLPETPTAEQAQVEWNDIVAPALPSLTQQLSEDLLFGALWERVLDAPARHLLV